LHAIIQKCPNVSGWHHAVSQSRDIQDIKKMPKHVVWTLLQGNHQNPCLATRPVAYRKAVWEELCPAGKAPIEWQEARILDIKPAVEIESW